MSDINDLLAELPARCRFVPQMAERVAFDQALAKGWTVRDLSETIIAGVGPSATNPSGLSCHILRSAAGTPPPAQTKVSTAGRAPGSPMPECDECGQPYGREGGYRPQPGDKGVDCVSCGEPLRLVQWNPRTQSKVGA